MIKGDFQRWFWHWARDTNKHELLFQFKQSCRLIPTLNKDFIIGFPAISLKDFGTLFSGTTLVVWIIFYQNNIPCTYRETCYYTAASPARWYHRYDSESWKRESSWVLLTFFFLCHLESINTNFSRMLQGWEALYYSLFIYCGLFIFLVWVYKFACLYLKEIALSLLW